MSTWVLLHGFTGAPASWDAVAAKLPGRVLAPALPGHGARPQPLEGWSAEIARLATWLEGEGVRGAHLVGYSMGGRLGWHLLDRDDLFARATLIGAHPGLDDAAARAERRAADARWVALLETEGLDAFLAAWEALPLWDTQRRLPAHLADRQRALRHSHTARGLAEALSALGLAEMPARPRARVPVKLVVGALDAKHRAIAEGLDAPLALVADTGHNVVLEAPSALVSELVP
ncbi:MAG: alpha/beta fold hydrolase [Myxococcales bacterium]|nr:alpha/beta fold hydrolase [Myxococcales bacterium]